MKRVIKLVALAIAGACIPLYAYISGVNDASEENVETVTYPDGTVVTKWNGGLVATAEPVNENSDEEEEEPLGV